MRIIEKEGGDMRKPPIRESPLIGFLFLYKSRLSSFAEMIA